MRRILVVSLAGMIIAGATLAVRIGRIDPTAPPTGRPYVTDLPNASSRLGRFLAQGDGQFYVALAIDPTLRHPERFSAVSEAAYRAQRPLLSYLAWGASLGRPRLAGWAIVGLCVLSAGFASGACAALGLRRSGSVLLGLVALLMPGSIAVLGGLGSELLALGFLGLGLLRWSDNRLGWVALYFALAAFARETTLIVPATLAVVELLSLRRRARIAAVVAPMGAWGAWLAVIRWRVGVLPGGSGRIGLPIVGFVQAVPHWTDTRANVAALAVGLTIVIALVVRRRTDLLGIVALAHLVLAAVAGPDVWHAWENFSRPLLPLYALGIVALGSRTATVRSVLPPRVEATS